MQSVLSFGGTSREAVELEEGFLPAFDTHIQLRHKHAVVRIADAPAGKFGYVIRRADGSEDILPGVCSTVKHAFTDPHARPIAPPGRKKGLSSRALGTLIHRHIFHQTECLRAKSCFCPCKTHDIPNAQAAQLLQVIKDKGWAPVRCELGVMAPEIGTATRVDMVCFDPMQSKFIHVSWKTGYKNVLKQPTVVENERASLRAPLVGVPDNERTWNQMQLLCEYLILNRRYQLDIAQSIIIYIRCDADDINRVLFDSAAPWWWNKPEVQNSVWDELVKCSRDGRADGQGGSCHGQHWK